MSETPAGTPPVTVIVPAHNESETIGKTLDDLRRLYPDYEILVIDDASSDGTGEIAEKAGARVVRNHVNKGYGGSLKRGMRLANAEIVVFIDADGQHDSNDVGRLIEAMKDCDMAIGERMQDDQVASRKPGKWILSAVADFLVGQHVPDINSGLRALYRKDGLRFLPILPNGFSLTTTITLAMFKDGCDVRYIPIRVASRGGGTSRVRYVRDGIKTLLLISRVTMLFNPLKVFAPVSVVLLTGGVLHTAYSVIVTRNIADANVLLLLSGMGMLFFGLLADQVASIRRGG